MHLSRLQNCSALTRHLTPPITSATSTSENVEISNIESMQTFVNTQNEQILKLLNVVQEVSPQLLGKDALKTSKGSEFKHYAFHFKVFSLVIH